MSYQKRRPGAQGGEDASDLHGDVTRAHNDTAAEMKAQGDHFVDLTLGRLQMHTLVGFPRALCPVFPTVNIL